MKTETDDTPHPHLSGWPGHREGRMRQAPGSAIESDQRVDQSDILIRRKQLAMS